MSNPAAGWAAPTGTRRLVAPELLPGLDVFPGLALDAELLAFMRSGEADSPMQPRPLTPAQQAVACEERLVPGPAGAPDVRVLIYRPGAAAGLRPAHLHIHGGGYVMGEPEFNDSENRTRVLELGCVVVAPAYRLAPETPFPGALQDCYAALKWLHAEADELGVDRARISIGGQSAGGGHAAALALYARDRGEVPIRFQLLDSPMIDDRTGASSEPHAYCGEFGWTPANNRFGWRALLGCEPGGPDTPAGASAARVQDLSGLPPTFIGVGALDLFLEENVEYARRLIRAGVPVELHVIPGAFHGFAVTGLDAPQIELLRGLELAALARAFQPA
jgi:triacylglycerol lipase